jgi:hypothetical protein
MAAAGDGDRAASSAGPPHDDAEFVDGLRRLNPVNSCGIQLRVQIVDDDMAYGLILWILTVLLFGRVVGQLVVYFFKPRFLPPMEQWQSGLVWYPALVATQIVVLGLMVSIAADFTRGAGFWVEPHPRLGMVVLWWSYLYFGAMVVRYIVWMAKRPDQRWTGGTIPIVFHSVVALFQWVFGAFHTGLI